MVKGRFWTYMDANGKGSLVNLCMPFLWLNIVLSSKSLDHMSPPSWYIIHMFL